MRGLRVVPVAVVAGLLLAAAAGESAAQTRPARDTMDRVVAVVGATPILQSEVDEEVNARARNQALPPEGSPEHLALRRQALQELIDLELLFQQSRTDTLVKVTDEQVNAAVDEQIRNVRAQYPSEQEWREDLRVSGFQTPDEYRRWLTDKQRRQLITSTFIDILKASGRIKDVMPTEREMRAFYDEHRANWRLPETVTFRQIVVAPSATEAARARALELADSILVELRAGADFATAARRFSDDPGSKDQGGALGWFRRGVMHPAFETVAFRLRPGAVSDPVETPFGFHLIQVERVQPAEIAARHILLSPALRAEDVDSARVTAERIRDSLRAGASFEALERRHHDPSEQASHRDFPLEQIPPAYAEMFGVLQDGQVSDVLTLVGPNPERSKFAVVHLLERRQAGQPRYEDVRDQIRRDLSQQLGLRRYLDGLRSAVYVAVLGP